MWIFVLPILLQSLVIQSIKVFRCSESSLLLGSHFWVVHNDSVKCSNEEMAFTTNLTMHACSTEEFACDNSFCIPMKERCDTIEDCLDGSDEQDCGTLIRRQGYKKHLTPVPSKGQDVLVNLSLNILDIEVDEANEAFTVRFSWSRNWFDGRLMFKHLKRESDMNTLLTEEGKAIWFPYLVFNNLRNKEDIKKTDVPDVLEVIPNQDFTYFAKDNMHIFKGSENALSQTRERNVNWKCEYAYHWYPFDTQVCRMEYASLRARTSLHPTHLWNNPNIPLDRYTLSRIRMCKSTINKMKAIVAEVTLGRPIIGNLLTVFVPTMLLLAISFAARFFTEEYIDMVIQVNLTILLVLSTM